MEIREKDLEIRKIEDDYHWRRSSENKNSESLMKGVDLLQLENMELKRDLDDLRGAIEIKEDRIRDMVLDKRKQLRVMDDLNTSLSVTSDAAEEAEPMDD